MRTRVSAVSSQSGTGTRAANPVANVAPLPSSPKHLPLCLSLHTPGLRKTTPSPSGSSPRDQAASLPASNASTPSSPDFNARTKCQKPENRAPSRLQNCNPSSLSDKSFPARNVAAVKEGGQDQRPLCQCPTPFRENRGSTARSSFWPRAADQIKQRATAQHAIPQFGKLTEPSQGLPR